MSSNLAVWLNTDDKVASLLRSLIIFFELHEALCFDMCEWLTWDSAVQKT